MIDQAVLDACIDFSERSLVVKRMGDSFQTKSGVLEYDLDSSVSEVIRVWCDSTELTPVDDDQPGAFGFLRSIPGQTQPTGTPRFFVQTDPGVIAFIPAPDRAYTINMRVAVRPSRSATQVEDQLFEDWCEVIVDGALSRLYIIPGDWANAGLHKLASTAFEVGINAAMIEARRGAMRADSRVTPVHI